mmetsp:Transcript_58996/g.169381  ORF Transcript_58996/g.169381 Transcript_58996/m.169381 type:complete len:317 (-) Transcript_58996:374-1324(-)
MPPEDGHLAGPAEHDGLAGQEAHDDNGALVLGLVHQYAPVRELRPPRPCERPERPAPEAHARALGGPLVAQRPQRRAPGPQRGLAEHLLAGTLGGPTVHRERDPRDGHDEEGGDAANLLGGEYRSLDEHRRLEDGMALDVQEGQDAKYGGDMSTEGLDHHQSSSPELHLPADEVQEEVAQTEQQEAQDDLDLGMDGHSEPEASWAGRRQDLVDQQLPDRKCEEQGNQEGEASTEHLVEVGPDLLVGAAGQDHDEKGQGHESEQHAGDDPAGLLVDGQKRRPGLGRRLRRAVPHDGRGDRPRAVLPHSPRACANRRL